MIPNGSCVIGGRTGCRHRLKVGVSLGRSLVLDPASVPVSDWCHTVALIVFVFRLALLSPFPSCSRAVDIAYQSL